MQQLIINFLKFLKLLLILKRINTAKQANEYL